MMSMANRLLLAVGVFVRRFRDLRHHDIHGTQNLKIELICGLATMGTVVAVYLVAAATGQGSGATTGRQIRRQVAAISRSQAVIEFQLDGTILTANENFLKTLGYTLERSRAAITACSWTRRTRQSDEYREFWAGWRAASTSRGRVQAVGKGGKEVWIQASYNPILDANGKPFKVVKYATDVTAAGAAARSSCAW